eukprot:jgi/Hompol1/1661/HPOL_005674-RA
MDFLFGASGQNAIGNRKLRVRIGPSPQLLTIANPNEEAVPHFIDSPYFVGHVVVRVRNFRGITPDGEPLKQADQYFGTRKRLFALQVCGRFKHEYTADDIVFGAEFDHKVSPPTGSWIALKFANLIDPALQSDIYSDKPWLFSPILCSMNIVNVSPAKTPIHNAAPSESIEKRSSKSSINNMLAGPDSSFKWDRTKDISISSAKATHLKPTPSEILGDWIWDGTKELLEDNALLVADHSDASFATDSISERRKFYQRAKARKETIFRPENIYNFEIFAPFIDLNTFDLTLGININLLRYLKKQPVRLMAKSQSKNIHLFVIEFDLVKTSDSDSGDTDDAEDFHSAEEIPPEGSFDPTANSSAPDLEDA